jgi:hypothetical protein
MGILVGLAMAGLTAWGTVALEVAIWHAFAVADHWQWECQHVNYTQDCVNTYGDKSLQEVGLSILGLFVGFAGGLFALIFLLWPSVNLAKAKA